MFDSLLLTCEHAGNAVPAEFAAQFKPHAALLASHRGWDPGALPIANVMAKSLGAPLLACGWTRLLIEPNRSLHHPALFSVISRELSVETREKLIADYYRPHREAVEVTLREWIDSDSSVLHIGVHTFTPELDGEVRNADIGLLYDPAAPLERALSQPWQRSLQAQAPELRIRRNYPYRGAADGLTSHLRKQLGTQRYAGFELEVNQALACQKQQIPKIAKAITQSLLPFLAPR